jgi:hypothetical protein
MEDKWDVFADGDRVRFQRSWTASPTDEGEAIRLESLIREVVLYEA